MTNQPKPAPTAEEREENECVRCYATMGIPYGLEPTEVCNLCAQEERLGLKSQLAEKDAKIAELEQRVNYPPDFDLEITRTALLAAWRDAQAKLRAVSEALDEKPKRYGSGRETFYDAFNVDALFARIRSILDSK